MRSWPLSLIRAVFKRRTVNGQRCAMVSRPAQLSSAQRSSAQLVAPEAITPTPSTAKKPLLMRSISELTFGLRSHFMAR